MTAKEIPAYAGMTKKSKKKLRLLNAMSEHTYVFPL
jgi:hypothetical protein